MQTLLVQGMLLPQPAIAQRLAFNLLVQEQHAVQQGIRPAQISTSAWRGEKAWRSMPKRAKSKRLAAVAMNSMAQHAVPNGIGHNEFARDQLTRSSSRSWNLVSR